MDTSHFSGVFSLSFVLKFPNAQNHCCSLQSIKKKQKNCASVSAGTKNLYRTSIFYSFGVYHPYSQVYDKWVAEKIKKVSLPQQNLRVNIKKESDVMQHAEHSCSAVQFPSVFKTLAALNIDKFLAETILVSRRVKLQVCTIFFIIRDEK
jgi:hypothetical protein